MEAILLYAAEAAKGINLALTIGQGVEAIAAQFAASNSALQAMVAENRNPSHTEWASLLQAQRAAIAAAPVAQPATQG